MDESRELGRSDPSVGDALKQIVHEMVTDPADKSTLVWEPVPAGDDTEKLVCSDCHGEFTYRTASRISNVIRCAACWERRIESMRQAAAEHGFKLNI